MRSLKVGQRFQETTSMQVTFFKKLKERRQREMGKTQILVKKSQPLWRIDT